MLNISLKTLGATVLVAVGALCLTSHEASAGTPPRKRTMFESLQMNPAIVKGGNQSHLSGNLLYLNKQRRWTGLSYKSVRIEIYKGNTLVATVPTRADGRFDADIATSPVRRSTAARYMAYFRGDSELSKPYNKSTRLQVIP